MSSEGPYGRHGFNANAGGYGGGASYGGGGGGGYAAPSYGGQNYGGAAAYSSPAAQGGGYGSQYGQYGGGSEGYQVRLVLFLVDNDGPSQIVAKLDFAVFLVVGILDTIRDSIFL